MGLDSCLKREITVAHSNNTQLTDFSVATAWTGKNIIAIQLKFSETKENLLGHNNSDSVSFKLRGEPITYAKDITNIVSVQFRDGNGTTGEDSDPDKVRVKELGTCGSLDRSEDKLSYTKTPEKSYTGTYTCTTKDGAKAKSITLSCGDDAKTKYEAVNDNTLSGKCIFKNDSVSHDVECRFNNENVDQQCHIRESMTFPLDPAVPVCGDGKKDYYEQCDYNQIDVDGNTLRENKKCTKKCTIITKPKDPDPIIPECGFVNTKQNKDGEKPVAMSVMTGEVMPFWWEVKDINANTVKSCDEPDSKNKIIKSTMKCVFELYEPGSSDPMPKEIITDCTKLQKTYSNIQRREDFLIPNGAATFDVSTYLGNNPKLGEYQLKFSKFDYKVCGANGEPVDAGAEDCCLVNFTVTAPYIIQDGLGAGKDLNAIIYGNINPFVTYFRKD